MIEKLPFLKDKTVSRLWFIGVSIVALFLIAVGGIVWGYQRQIQTMEENIQATRVVERDAEVERQYSLGVEELEAGLYEDAKTRFEFVIQTDPDYPGAKEKLAEALLALYTAPTSTPIPDTGGMPEAIERGGTPTTPTITPTVTPTVIPPDREELFAAIQDMILNQEWKAALQALQTLRLFHPDFKPTEVDGMFFTVYRNRGVQQIDEGSLADGIYTLHQASKFGMLDQEARNKQDWAGYYLAGMGYWEVDWEKVIFYFEDLVQNAPRMKNAAGVTAKQRYQQAAAHYANFLFSEERWCEAEIYYQISLEYGGKGEELIDLYNQSIEKCSQFENLSQ